MPSKIICGTMTADSPRFVDVLLPLALEGAYSYEVPAGMQVEPGSYVAVPLGPRAGDWRRLVAA